MDTQSLIWTTGVSFAIAIILGPAFIPFLRRLKFGQSIRTEGPQSHRKKAGTPTMGGIVFLIAAAITALQFSDRSFQIYLLLFVTLGYGLVGFLDDYIKVVMKRNLGLRARQKLFGQVLVAVFLFIALYMNGFDTHLSIPFTKISWGLGWMYLPFLVFLVIGFSNAVNLTDGLDGLAAGTSAVAFATYALVAFWSSQFDVAVFSTAMVGAILGFLVFNAHPAKVFMGDTGSLALGGALATVAVLTKTELLLVLIGGVFVVETLSVILQVFSFQVFGRRIFKMSPLHHHFELLGWSEWQVVSAFWGTGVLLSALGIGYFLK